MFYMSTLVRGRKTEKTLKVVQELEATESVTLSVGLYDSRLLKKI